jgi:hypothetical protein
VRERKMNRVPHRTEHTQQNANRKEEEDAAKMLNFAHELCEGRLDLEMATRQDERGSVPK